MKKSILGLLILLLAGSGFAQEPQPQVTDVWVVFKTHFDLGYTDLPENVFARYRGEMMDKALKVIEKNTQLPPEKHFSWTVAGWPLQRQILGPLQLPERKTRIEKAIREGSLVVHGLPFTMHTGSLDYEDLVRGLEYSSIVNRTYGLLLTISAKMTDVPSHSWVMRQKKCLAYGFISEPLMILQTLFLLRIQSCLLLRPTHPMDGYMD